ncbi:hypothetical protein NQ315_017330 [Exocentrus adspersus]|uniref:Uncharacterized protein n=1 Tax=Exocentrus adspersus TaxID=1586481 RepID=A0AAV8VE33_9CUCU|nr:hypothetical protein NQ315_017330 [Exocentrus adspersus]
MAVVAKFIEFSAESEEWLIYRERLDQHFEANKIVDAKVKTAVLLSSVGPSTYKLLRNSCHPQLPKEKSYEVLCSSLDGQYNVQLSAWRERKKFYELRQTDENVSEWYAKVRSYAINCKFRPSLDKVLKDKFRTGDEEKSVLELVTIAQKVENFSKVSYLADFTSNHNRQEHHRERAPRSLQPQMTKRSTTSRTSCGSMGHGTDARRKQSSDHGRGDKPRTADPSENENTKHILYLSAPDKYHWFVIRRDTNDKGDIQNRHPETPGSKASQTAFIFTLKTRLARTPPRKNSSVKASSDREKELNEDYDIGQELKRKIENESPDGATAIKSKEGEKLKRVIDSIIKQIGNFEKVVAEAYKPKKEILDICNNLVFYAKKNWRRGTNSIARGNCRRKKDTERLLRAENQELRQEIKCYRQKESRSKQTEQSSIGVQADNIVHKELEIGGDR